jgi:4-diphosphocytidyl-2-C-methyl-D-erythritol kinase
MTAITELARAKVNLTLRVRGRRTDGYHQLESLITFADAGDRLHFVPGATTSVDVGGRFADAISGPNLIETALARLSAAAPPLVLGSVTLEKCLPVAAGIGGGSADAAALLRAVRRANPPLAGGIDWRSIAAALGADVPVCLESEAAVVWGMGERIEPVRGLPRLHAVLVNPLAPVPPDKTSQVFARLGAPNVAAELPPMVSPTQLANPAALLDFMRTEGNDLLEPAIATVPEIAEVRAALAGLPGCLYVGLSGAGPTNFGIFAESAGAAAAASSLQQSRPEWWVAAASLGC